jgi:hypothetical protein
VLEHERPMILTKSHKGIVGGHYVGKEIAQKKLCARIWWPTLPRDAKLNFQTYDVCKRVGNPSKRDEMHLNPHVTLHAFDKWAIKFVGPINPQTRRSGARYIITTMEYMTRWAEATPVLDFTVETAA